MLIRRGCPRSLKHNNPGETASCGSNGDGNPTTKADRCHKDADDWQVGDYRLMKADATQLMKPDARTYCKRAFQLVNVTWLNNRLPD